MFSLQKKKADGPTLPEQPAKRPKSSDPVSVASPVVTDPTPGDNGAEELRRKVETQGEKIRRLKTSGADKVGYVHV